MQFLKKKIYQPYLERYSVVVVIAEVLLLINEKTNKIKLPKTESFIAWRLIGFAKC